MAEPSDEWQRVAGRERPYYRCQNSSLRKELREHKSEPHMFGMFGCDWADLRP